MYLRGLLGLLTPHSIQAMHRNASRQAVCGNFQHSCQIAERHVKLAFFDLFVTSKKQISIALMNAPDEHWLLVKNLWLPIENGLDTLGAIGEDAREKIDSLAGKLSSSLIDQLHYLRMERNALIHKNKPLGDHKHWETTALSVQESIRRSSMIEGGGTSEAGSWSLGSLKDLLVMLMGLAILGIGSWYLKEFCNFLFTKVNQFSLAWWLIGTIWLLCWPGILVAGLVGGILLLLAKGIYWLLTYFVTHPV